MTGEAGAARRVTGPQTALALLRRATTFLAARGSATPRLDSELLLAAVLATDRVGVYLRFDRPLAAADMETYRGLLVRRAAGEPVAYLTGRREFWSCDLAVTPDVLIPRPETELLVERALAVLPDVERPARILDLGTGSGALAIALAVERPAASVVALELSRAAARMARANAVAVGVGARVAVLVSDWTEAVAPAARFDVIVANPPYVETGALATLPREVRSEPRLALDGGADGLDAYRRLVPGAAPLLRAGGRMLLEVGAGQAAAVAALCGACGLVDVAWHTDLGGVKRVVGASVG